MFLRATASVETQPKSPNPEPHSHDRFACYGFGGKLPTGQVSHCFALNGDPKNPEVKSKPQNPDPQSVTWHLVFSTENHSIQTLVLKKPRVKHRRLDTYGEPQHPDLFPKSYSLDSKSRTHYTAFGLSSAGIKLLRTTKP